MTGVPAGSPASTGWRFAIDRGGTFTDVVGIAPDGSLHIDKVLSQDPAHPGDPALRGIARVLQRHGPRHGQRVASVRLGTTVATNALLERTGAPTLLVVSAGMRDALAIGTQERPDIFARAIRKPPPLYADVVEVPERIDADGVELTALDEAALRAQLFAGRERGLTACAIGFLHGFRHPAHERRAAALARECGYAEVVASHDAAPLLGFLARASTAVADAYLSPVLLRYTRDFVASLRQAHGDVAVSFMQSNGGLVDDAGFRGVNGVLSGPAGGVVGMIEAGGAAAGSRPLIGFDMGGTSTDVSLAAAGAVPRRYEIELDGVRLRTPVVDVHTIAAGGGSILRLADGRLQVGPSSAGANPGPACYRRGGPATVTDCNVVLGRIIVEHFPHVFGPGGDEPLDPTQSRLRLQELARQAQSETGTTYSVEQLAAACVAVAVTRMANAIRELALHRGEDPARCALVCFGGAAGQHACAVAEALGMADVVLHPLAGVLSAYGILLSGRRVVRRRSVESALDAAGHAEAADALEHLATAARQELLRQGVRLGDCELRLTAQVRAAGSDVPLDLDWQALPALRAAFRDAHQQLYGFVDAQAALVVASVIAEAIERTSSPPGLAVAAGPRTPAVTLHQRTWLEGEWREVPVRLRSDLRLDDTVAGPLLLCEAGATSWIAPGWTGRVVAGGALRLQRDSHARAKPVAAVSAAAVAPDPMRLEVCNALFMHVAEQMGAVLRHTASSVNIKERLDFSCALFDADANLVANAPHMPVHLGSMGASVAAVRDAFRGEFRPGDACIVNSPYAGGTHLPDVTVVAPVFDSTGRHIEFFTASRAHHADIGGITPGSMPPHSRDIAEEGALIEPCRIVRDGVLDEQRVRELLGTGRWPARNLPQNVADLRAQLAANARGASELERAAREFGRDVLLAYMGHVQDNAERCMRRAIARLRDGEFRYEMDNGQVVAVRVAVDRECGKAIVDFSGTSAQQANNFNAPRAVTTAAVLYVFRTLLDEPIPLNAGCLRPLEIVVPRGSMLDPLPPAAVVAGNVETSQCIVDALYGALGLQAAAQGTMNNFTFGNERYQYYETIAGGAGAGPGYDGASGVQTHMTNSRLTDPEVLETRFPVLLREFSIRRGSGGRGAHRGGDGLRRRVEFREPMTAAVLSNHRRVAPFGLEGGGAGEPGRNAVMRAGSAALETLAATCEVFVQPGDQLQVETPGGGGFGPEQGRGE
jgi:5-oxoprolinase (ATP-hydrolysing)